MEVEVVEVVGELGQELVDGVRANGGRDPLASVNAWEERMEMSCFSLQKLNNAENSVMSFSGLLQDILRHIKGEMV